MKLRLFKTFVVCAMTAVAIPASAQLFTYTDATDGSPFSVAPNVTGTSLVRNFCDTSFRCETGFRSDHTSKNGVFGMNRSNAQTTLTPDAGYEMTVTSMSAELRRNIKGPSKVRLAYSTDGGITWVSNGSDMNLDSSVCDDMNSFSWDIEDFTTTAPTIFRVYFFASGGVNGSVQLKNVVISGDAVDIDVDNDGYTNDVDCNDENPEVNPGATEICNFIDDNCDGNIDEGIITATIEADGELSFCRNTGVTLSANVGDGYTYQWYNNGIAADGETNQTAFVDASANVTVVVTTAEGCSDESDVVSTVRISTPVANVHNGDDSNDLCVDPEIKLKANEPGDVTYQWYMGEDMIDGATDVIYMATAPGFYSVELTSVETGCTDRSDEYEVIEDCRLGLFNGQEVSVYPNPSAGTFTIEAAVTGDATTAFIQVINLTGEVIWNAEVDIMNNLVIETIELQNPIAAGIYLVTINCGQGQITTQVQIQN